MRRTASGLTRLVFALMGLASLTAAIAGSAQAGVIYDATGGATLNGADTIDPNAPGGVGPVVADRFFSPVATTLTSVTLNLELVGPALNGFTIDLWPDSTSTPGLPVFGSEVQIAAVSDSSLTSTLMLYTFTPTSPISLAANTFYDIGIDTHTVAGDRQVTNVAFGNTQDPSVLARLPVAVGALYFHTVGGVDPNSDGPYDLIVQVAAPEASTWAMMGAGFVGLAFVGYRARKRRACIA